MKAIDLITRAGILLFDQGNARWTKPQLLDYISDAQMEVVRKVPNSHSLVSTIELTPGTQQTIPSDAIQLLRVIRNMGGGEDPGPAILLTARGSLDAHLPNWHSVTSAVVQHYVYDPDSNRRTYWVFPGADQVGRHIEIAYTQRPTVVTDENQDLDLEDQYLNPVLDWVLYRAYVKDSEDAGNLSMARHYFQAFYADLGLDTQIRPIQDPRGDTLSGRKRQTAGGPGG